VIHFRSASSQKIERIALRPAGFAPLIERQMLDFGMSLFLFFCRQLKGSQIHSTFSDGLRCLLPISTLPCEGWANRGKKIVGRMKKPAHDAA
jgi:hypothetical protein